MRQFDYEQCPRSGGWVYKFDHRPLSDGQWHPLNADSRARYRVIDGYIQYVSPGQGFNDDQLRDLLARLSGPLDTSDELEITIQHDHGGFVMRSRIGPRAVPFDRLDGADLERAYRRLCELE